jgi:hypothetical protein
MPESQRSRGPQPRRVWEATTTDEARAEIPALQRAEREAWRAWDEAVKARDVALARHRAAGVIQRDLQRLTVTEDNPEGMNPGSVFRAIARGFKLIEAEDSAAQGDAGGPTAGGE